MKLVVGDSIRLATARSGSSSQGPLARVSHDTAVAVGSATGMVRARRDGVAMIAVSLSAKSAFVTGALVEVR